MGLHEDIKGLIEENGAQGVNQLAKALNIPLSTMQKYMDKQQTYFKKTMSRKWDLPERVQETELTGMSQNVATIIESQLTGINATYDLLNQQIKSIINLSAALKPVVAPSVANSYQRDVDPLIKDILDQLDKLPDIFNHKKKNIPDEYYSLLQNTKWLQLVLETGTHYFRDVVSPSIYSMCLGESTELSEDALTTIKEYQREV